MMKKWLKAIAAIAFAAAISGGVLTACKKGTPNLPEDNKDSEQSAVTISLSATEVVVDAYDFVTVKATVTNSQESVVWRSADSSIATVTDGVVAGIKEGETTITASVGEIYDECKVIVVKSSELPETQLNYRDSVSMLTGDSLTLSASTEWKGKPCAAVTYEWALEEGQEVVELENGEADGSYVVTAAKAGSTKLTLKTSAVGETVLTELTVNVADPVYDFVIENAEKNDDGYVKMLWREPGENAEFALSYLVTRGGAEMNDAIVTWSSDNEDVATIDNNGKIVATANGVAHITATVGGKYITEFSVTLELTVDEKVYYNVCYYDIDKTTLLHTDKVLKGEDAPAAFEYENLPADKDLGNGYTAQYTAYHWVNDKGALVADELKSLTENVNVYVAFDYESVKTYEYKAAYTGTLSDAAAKVHKDIAVKNGKIEMTFKVYADNVCIGFVIPSPWTEVRVWCYPNKTYKAVLNFKDGVGTTATFYENGVPMDAANEKDISAFTIENLNLSISLPLLTWDPTYAESGRVDIGVAVTEVKRDPHKIVYKNADGTILNEEIVEDGDAATYRRSDETTADGYSVTYENKWKDAEGNNVNLASVKSDITVYYAGETLHSKHMDSSSYLLPKNMNKYISSIGGITTFKIRIYTEVWTSFTVYQGIRYSHWDTDKLIHQGVDASQNLQWFTIIINENDSSVTVSAPGGASKRVAFTDFNAEEITIVSTNPFDIAA